MATLVVPPDGGIGLSPKKHGDVTTLLGSLGQLQLGLQALVRLNVRFRCIAIAERNGCSLL